MLSLLKKGTSRFFSENLKNPETIIIKNKFYSSGLTENDIYQYYIQNKKNILDEVYGRDVMLFLQTDKNLIVKRKDKTGEHFRLNNNNYNELIHGRVVSIHSTMNHNEDVAIVDIDVDNFRLAKNATGIIYDYLKKSESLKSIKIRYTGKESFHIVLKFNTYYPIDKTRLYLRHLLKKKFEDKYDVESKRTTGKVNIDLSSNKYHGGFITLGSLSVWGLRCMEIPRGKLIRFNQNEAKIK